MTTGMPAPVVATPPLFALAFLIGSNVVPVAEPLLPLMTIWSVVGTVAPSAVFSVTFAPVPPTSEPTVKVLNPPDGEKTMALLVRLRLVIVDEPVVVQFVLLVKETLVVEVASVWIAPVSVDALVLNLMVAVDGSAKIRSPEALVMLKLSKVATALVALVKLIALPAAVTVPPP